MGKKIKSFLFAEEILVPFLILFFVFFSLLPTLKFFFQTPQDAVYTFLHNSVSDYPYYISFIRQGVLGKTTTFDQFTSEEQSPSFIHIFYLCLGRLGRFFTSSPLEIYFFARLVLGVFFLLSVFLFIREFFPQKKVRLLAFLFFLTGVSFPHLVFHQGRWEIWSYLYWWTEMDAFNRVTFIPHFLFGHLGLVLGFLFFFKIFRQFRPFLFFSGIIFANFVGLSHPPSLGMLYYVFGVYLFFALGRSLFWEKKLGKEILVKIFLYFLFVFLTFPSLYYIYRTTTKVFPWTLMGTQESLFYHLPLWEYLLALGPLFPLGIFGAFLVLLRREKKIFQSKRLILIFWLLVDILMIPLSKKIAFSSLPFKIPTFANIRFLSMVLHLPLAILAADFFQILGQKSKKLGVLVSLFFVFFTLPVLGKSLLDQFRFPFAIASFLYPQKSLVKAFIFLDSLPSERQERVVLAPAVESLLLPLFARNKVFFGQAIYTFQNEEKKKLAEKFFTGQMSVCEVYHFLRKGKIGYVLAKTQESAFLPKYPFLKVIYPKFSLANSPEKNLSEGIFIWEFLGEKPQSCL